MKAIAGGFTRLLQFSGRDQRGTFWPYAGLIFSLAFCLIPVAMWPGMEGFTRTAFEIAEASPQDVSITVGTGGSSIAVRGDHPEIEPHITRMMLGVAAVVGVAALLLAAAVVRRLHDVGRSGLWALAPLIFLCSGIGGMTWVMPRFMAGEPGADAMGGFLLLFANNLLYMASLATLIVFLALPSRRTDNRWGPAGP